MIDLVISGPDMSGTSTQIQGIIKFFQNKGKKVRDIRGTEMDALFHASLFSDYNQDHISYKEFLEDKIISEEKKQKLSLLINNLMIGGATNEDLKVASMVENVITTYINPDSADVWIMEEPTKRGSGQVNRVIEQNRSKFNSSLDASAAAFSHQAYRIDEFLRFRKILREKGKIVVRSRSEESACYQLFDEKVLPHGIHKEHYLTLPGHKIAFSHPPTHVFIVCALEGWTTEQYIEFKRKRSNGRSFDDHEANTAYQILVNERYRKEWLEELYRAGCGLYGSKRPSIIRFNIYDSMSKIQEKMNEHIEKILTDKDTDLSAYQK